MKSLNFLFIIILLNFSLVSLGQKKTFYMDTLTVERGSEKIIFNRSDCPVNLFSNETSKSVYLGLLGTDSVHINLKQGLINVNSKSVPVLLFDFIIKSENNSIVESTSGHYEHFFPNSLTRSWTSFNVFKLHYAIKADSTTYKLLPNSEYSNNKFQIIHSLEDISIGKKSFKKTPSTFSDNIENNVPTDKVTICTYKKTPIFYTISVHPISSFPEIKIISLNFSYKTILQSRTFIMNGNEAVSEEHTNGSSFFFLTNYKSKKFIILNAKPKYLINLKN